MNEQATRTPRGRTSALTADRVVRWAVRLLWVGLPFTAGPAVGDALASASRAVQVVASTGLWLAWAAGVVASAVALPVSLTVVRFLAPAAVAAVLAAAAGGHSSPLAIGWAAVTAGWVFAPTFGLLCVNGPAYPNERRYPLRAPGALLFGPLPFAWAAAVTGIAAGPLLLAARQWVAGGGVTVVGLALATVLLRGMHDLSRRWLVFVPAGVVVHDPLSLVDPVLLHRRDIVRVGPAAVGTSALDLTQNAPGLALELAAREEQPFTLVRPGRRTGDTARSARVLVTPTRPGAVLAESRRRRLPVG